MNRLLDNTANVTISVIGPLTVISPEGKNITPAGKKAKAIIALLALAPNGVRNRKWLQSILWSNRTSEQGAASLRQEISSLKKHFSSYDLEFIISDREQVQIDLNNSIVDTKYLMGGSINNELLEGIDANDEEFEDWLRLERRSFAENHERTKKEFKVGDRLPRLILTDFVPIGNSQREKVFASGLSEELLTILGSLIGSFTITKSHPTDITSYDYEISGSVRLNHILRISARLVSLIDGHCLWSGRFDYPENSGFDAQEEISRQIIENAQIKLSDGTWAEIWADKTTSIEAWEEYQIGRICEGKFQRQSTSQAIQHYKSAIRLDSKFIPAKVALGFCYLDQFRLGWTLVPSHVLDQVSDLINDIRRENKTDPYALTLEAYLENAMGHFETAEEKMKVAVELSSQSPEMLAYLGALNGYHGNSEDEIKCYELALKLTKYPPTWIKTNMALAYLLKNSDNATLLLDDILNENSFSVRANVFKVADLARLGRYDEAEEFAKRVYELEPNFKAEKWSSPDCFQNKKNFYKMADWLMSAGL